MPIYEYQCLKCHKISEFLIGVGQGDAKIQCKHCGSKELNRIFSKSFVTMGRGIQDSYNGKTCCGRDERCEKPPCFDGGQCTR